MMVSVTLQDLLRTNFTEMNVLDGIVIICHFLSKENFEVSMFEVVLGRRELLIDGYIRGMQYISF